MPPSSDGEKAEMEISGPFNQPTQEEIANYDPSAELVADPNGVDYGPSEPSQLDNALVNRASRLSTSRKSFLDIYGGANTPYPQDVVDGSGRPLTQQFLMPEADKFQNFQLNGLGPMSPFNPKVPGLTSGGPAHQRNISTLSNLPEDVNPDQPAPYTGQEDPVSPIDPEDPFGDENTAPLPPLAAAGKMGGLKSQNKAGRKRADSWMTVNTVATTKPGAPSRSDYTSVYMRNPFIDAPEGAAGGSKAPPMPAIPKHLQQQQQTGQGKTRQEQTESVTLMFSPSNLQPQPPHSPHQQHGRPLSGPGETEVMYGGVLDDYPPHPPSTRITTLGPRKTAGTTRSNPFDLEVDDGGDGPDDLGAGVRAGGGDFRDDGTVKSVQSWLSGIADAERDRMERDNVI